jgi:hypothetical protein
MTRWIYDIMNAPDGIFSKAYFAIYIVGLVGSQILVATFNEFDLMYEI